MKYRDKLCYLMAGSIPLRKFI